MTVARPTVKEREADELTEHTKDSTVMVKVKDRTAKDCQYYKDFSSFFLQEELSNPCVVEACKKLNPKYLYLDTCSSFHQVFKEDHVKDLKQVSIASNNSVKKCPVRP